MSTARAGERLHGPDGTGWRVLPREFFDRPVLEVAPDLLGRVLIHQTGEGTVSAEIVEVEAYRGESDPASHAFRGKTARNAVMFGQPGHAYVYFTYGMHFCVNLVCQPAGVAAAVLLRAGRVVEGTALATTRRLAGYGTGRGTARASTRNLARGPARLCQALAIGRAQNGADVCDPLSQLRVLSDPAVGGRPRSIAAGPRVGVRNGAQVHWRFWIEGESAVSVYRPHVPRRSAHVTGAEGSGSMHR